MYSRNLTYEAYPESKYCLGIKKIIQIIFKIIYFSKILHTLIYVSTSVSYTHLDVYKRQVHTVKHITSLKINYRRRHVRTSTSAV